MNEENEHNTHLNSLIEYFESICRTNGDDTAFFLSHSEGESSSSVGFTELQQSVNSIAWELSCRHGLSAPMSSSSLGLSQQTLTTTSPSPLQDKCHPSVLIISTYPCPGEAAAMLACTKLGIPFVPLVMDGPQGVGADRMKAMLEDCKAEAAIVTITLPQVEHDHEYDWENRPAMASTVNTIDMDQHPSILKLNSFGIHRIIPVNALDGSVIDPMLCTFEEESLTLPSTLQDDSVLYLLYTSGSTGRPKAVVQSHSSLRSRITWGWKTFPFVQQMRRNLGANETMRRLKKDGVVCDGICGDVVMRRTPLMFVDSMTEIFGSLLAGVPLWCRIPSPNEIQAKRMWTQDIAECLELATKHEVHVSRITCLPSQFAQVLNIKKDSKSVVTCTDARADDWSSHLNLIIVSGEPCPNTLPTLFEEVMSKCRNQAALLVNLYGQTETSGDVLCLIVGYSGKHSFGRCPEAEKYIWKKRKSTFQEDRSYQHNSKDISLDAISDIERMKKSMVPCGLPIDGHSFHFAKMDTSLAGNSIDLVTFDEEEGIGRLYVEGPGVALGYLNRTHEMNHNFCQHETNCKGSLGFIFNTQDVAFRDKETGFFFIVGRAPSVDSCGQLINALTMGKVNGVMIHVAEIESVFKSAFAETISQHSLNPCTGNDIDVIASFIKYEGKGDSNINRIAVFIDLSILPINSNEIVSQRNSSQVLLLDPTECKVYLNEKSFNMHELLLKTNSLLIHSESEFKCHPALVPKHTFIVSSLPRTGGAGKIDRGSLANLASGNMNQDSGHSIQPINGFVEDNEDGDLVRKIVGDVCIAILGIKSLGVFFGASFAELGGDSLTAIDAAHKIMSKVQVHGTLRNNGTISGADLVQYSLGEICHIIMQGKEGMSHKKRKIERYEKLPVVGDLHSGIFHHVDDGSNIRVAWKIPLLMCVDSCPLLFEGVKDKDSTHLIAVGSQGGDVLLVNDSGRNIHRCKLNGKIEGGMTVMIIEEKNRGVCFNKNTILFGSTYNIESMEEKGCLKAFQLNSNELMTQTLSPLWCHCISSEIKNKPVAFRFKDTNAFRVIIGAYDGSVSYLNAEDGELLDCNTSIKGAIHADPLLIIGPEDDLSLIVATSSWNGTVAKFSVGKNSLIALWSMNMWAPIYSTPFLVDEKNSFQNILFLAVDGSVTSLKANDGSESWKILTKEKKPIFTGCCPLTIENERYVVFGSHDGIIRCISSKNGSIKWTFNVVSPVISKPILLEADNQVFVACTSGRVFLLDAKDGKKLKVSRCVRGEIFSSPTLDAENKAIYVGCRDSHLYKLWI